MPRAPCWVPCAVLLHPFLLLSSEGGISATFHLCRAIPTPTGAICACPPRHISWDRRTYLSSCVLINAPRRLLAAGCVVGGPPARPRPRPRVPAARARADITAFVCRARKSHCSKNIQSSIGRPAGPVFCAHLGGTAPTTRRLTDHRPQTTDRVSALLFCHFYRPPWYDPRARWHEGSLCARRCFAAHTDGGTS